MEKKKNLRKKTKKNSVVNLKCNYFARLKCKAIRDKYIIVIVSVP